MDPKIILRTVKLIFTGRLNLHDRVIADIFGKASKRLRFVTFVKESIAKEFSFKGMSPSVVFRVICKDCSEHPRANLSMIAIFSVERGHSFSSKYIGDVPYLTRIMVPDSFILLAKDDSDEGLLAGKIKAILASLYRGIRRELEVYRMLSSFIKKEFGCFIVQGVYFSTPTEDHAGIDLILEIYHKHDRKTYSFPIDVKGPLCINKKLLSTASKEAFVFDERGCFGKMNVNYEQMNVFLADLFKPKSKAILMVLE